MQGQAELTACSLREASLVEKYLDKQGCSRALQAFREEAWHLLNTAAGTDAVEDLSMVLAEHGRLIARQQLLESVSKNPIMNDLFTVINLQVARVLTQDQQPFPSTSHGHKPADQEPSQPESISQEISGNLQQQQHALGPRQSDSTDLLLRASQRHAGISPVSPSKLCKGRQPLKPIPEDDGQAMGGAARHMEAYEQRDLIHTPSQNSAEGALVGLESTTPHPACAIRSSTATSAVKRPIEGPPRTAGRPNAAPPAPPSKLPAQVQGPWWMTDVASASLVVLKEQMCVHNQPQNGSAQRDLAIAANGSWHVGQQGRHTPVPCQNAAQAMQPCSDQVIRNEAEVQAFPCNDPAAAAATNQPQAARGCWWMVTDDHDAAATTVPAASAQAQHPRFLRALSQASRSHASSSPSAGSHPGSRSPFQPHIQVRSGPGQGQAHSSNLHGHADQAGSRAGSPDVMDHEEPAHGPCLPASEQAAGECFASPPRPAGQHVSRSRRRTDSPAHHSAKPSCKRSRSTGACNDENSNARANSGCPSSVLPRHRSLPAASLLLSGKETMPSRSIASTIDGHLTSPAASPQPFKSKHDTTAQHKQGSDAQKPAALPTAIVAGNGPSASQLNDPAAGAKVASGQVGGGVDETVGRVQQLLAAAQDNPALAGLIQSAAEQHGLSMDSIASITQHLPRQLPTCAVPQSKDGAERPPENESSFASPRPSEPQYQSCPSLRSPELDFDLADLGLDMSMIGSWPDPHETATAAPTDDAAPSPLEGRNTSSDNGSMLLASRPQPHQNGEGIQQDHAAHDVGMLGHHPGHASALNGCSARGPQPGSKQGPPIHVSAAQIKSASHLQHGCNGGSARDQPKQNSGWHASSHQAAAGGSRQPCPAMNPALTSGPVPPITSNYIAEDQLVSFRRGSYAQVQQQQQRAAQSRGNEMLHDTQESAGTMVQQASNPAANAVTATHASTDEDAAGNKENTSPQARQIGQHPAIPNGPPEPLHTDHMQQQQHLIWQADSAILDLESGGSGMLDLDSMLDAMDNTDGGSLLQGLEECFDLSELDCLSAGDLDTPGLDDRHEM
ncbi:hypothetical protein WJX74_008607 [Apatococcus lobatus]|uniref:LisH domain-containing protein n=1 Tax=Apatococcus lobatus TaxID=904363 RepID=A0AAW1RCF5_9CHLO